MVRILDATQVKSLLDIGELLSVIETAMVKQGSGEVVRPERPHFPVGEGLDPERPDKALGTGLTMPAYIHGSDYYATKLVGFFEDNPTRDLPTITAQIVVNEADTGLPVAVMDGSHVTGMRTGCIGGLAARELANKPVTLGVIGAGTQARWQTRAIAAATDVERVRIYSPSNSRFSCANELNEELNVPVEAIDSARDAVEPANTVVTATSAESPVLNGDWLSPGTLVIAVGAFSPEMQELDQRTFDRANKVFADVPGEAHETGDVIAADLTDDAIGSLATVLEGTSGRDSEGEIIVVESVGSAVFDAATAASVVELAEAEDVGTLVDL
ncbi:ornithine cyclodeaminase family protein [Halobacterium sp. KA-6]|uniref:ornithine cyclodeaminase family protein n=1 Tax=Halobacterium sp. KA-6 TaxID=2896368 RepID=UPI001E57B961|nr:ornithine cyclodeaminase family protein [Halobacterium sp. KA-6]MCD2204582.1 ornithine cyclodeaminase family protein [Halobacterium sp. KA-6]